MSNANYHLKRRHRLTPALLFLLGSVSVLVLGALTGNFPGDSTVDIHLHDTYFVIAHSHLMVGVAGFFGMFAAIYHWFPRIFGRLMNDTLGYIHTWVTILVTLLIFWRMHYDGVGGMPRRYVDNKNWLLFDLFNDLNKFIPAAALIVFAVQALFIFNFCFSIFRGPTANTRRS